MGSDPSVFRYALNFDFANFRCFMDDFHSRVRAFELKIHEFNCAVENPICYRPFIQSKGRTLCDTRYEWLSGLYSSRQVTEAKLGRLRSNSEWGDLGGPPSQLASPSFGSGVKLGIPCLTTACIVGIN